MIIKFVRKHKNEEAYKDSYLELGKEYICLAIISYGEVIPSQVVIESALDGHPRSCNLDCFDIIDLRIPDGWIFLNLKEGYFSLTPKEFGEDCWSYIEAGREIEMCIFIMVVNKIRAFHNMPARDKIWRSGI